MPPIYAVLRAADVRHSQPARGHAADVVVVGDQHDILAQARRGDGGGYPARGAAINADVGINNLGAPPRKRRGQQPKGC